MGGAASREVKERRKLIHGAKARLTSRAASIRAADKAIADEATTVPERKAARDRKKALEAKEENELEAENKEAIEEAAKRLREMAEDDLDELRKKYSDPEPILKALKSGATVMLRGSWLRDRPPGYVLPRREELELLPGALIPAAEVEKVYQKSTGGDAALGRFPALPLIAISHYWRSKVHPDPEGVTCALIAAALKAQWHRYEAKGVSEVAIFFDWCSLWQEPRSTENEQAFKDSLGSINIWYAHQLTSVYFVRGGEAGGLTYAEKGWTSFEYRIALLIKPPNSAGHVYGDRIYTNGADRDNIVAPKFETTVEEVLGGVHELNLRGEQWGDGGVVALTKWYMPLCVSLKVLYLGETGMGDTAAKALGKTLGAMRALEVLDLLQNEIGDVGAVALAAGLRAPLMELNLIANPRISGVGKAAVRKAAEAIGRLRHLRSAAKTGQYLKVYFDGDM